MSQQQKQPSCLGGVDLVDHDDAWVRSVMRQHAPPVGSLLRSRYPVLTAEDVEDVVTIAMIRLWNARDRFDPAKASLRTYLFRIADNVARNVIKCGWVKARRMEVPLDEKLVARPASGKSRETSPQRNALLQDLRAVLDRLPEAYRTIVLTDACAPGRVADAAFLAQELQIPAGTVRVYRHRAMKAIRTSLEEAGYKLP